MCGRNIMNQKLKQPVIKLDDIWKIYQIGDVKVEALRGVSVFNCNWNDCRSNTCLSRIKT